MTGLLLPPVLPERSVRRCSRCPPRGPCRLGVSCRCRRDSWPLPPERSNQRAIQGALDLPCMASRTTWTSGPTQRPCTQAGLLRMPIRAGSSFPAGPAPPLGCARYPCFGGLRSCAAGPLPVTCRRGDQRVGVLAVAALDWTVLSAAFTNAAWSCPDSRYGRRCIAWTRCASFGALAVRSR
jgi:hypothetical protein